MPIMHEIKSELMPLVGGEGQGCGSRCSFVMSESPRGDSCVARAAQARSLLNVVSGRFRPGRVRHMKIN